MVGAAVIAATLALLAGVALLAGCGTSAAPPSTAAEAYALAHPTGQIPPSLRAVDLTRRQVGRRVADIVGDGVRILLPLHLPPGFGPAAPYIAVGDGTARPNPEGWGSSYRVSYTDGEGLLVITCGATRVPEGVVWSAEKLRVDGRPARAGLAEGAVVVATVGDRPLIVVSGRHVPRGRLLACAASMAPWR